jgi:hypothetical protein
MYCVFLPPCSWNWDEVAGDGEFPWRIKTGLSGYAVYGQADIYGHMPFPVPAIICSLKIQAFCAQNRTLTLLLPFPSKNRLECKREEVRVGFVCIFNSPLCIILRRGTWSDSINRNNQKRRRSCSNNEIVEDDRFERRRR